MIDNKLTKLELAYILSEYYGDYISFHYDDNGVNIDIDLYECLPNDLRELFDLVDNWHYWENKSESYKEFYNALDEYLDYLVIQDKGHILISVDLDDCIAQYKCYFHNKNEHKYYKLYWTHYQHLDDVYYNWNKGLTCIEVIPKEKMQLVTIYEEINNG